MFARPRKRACCSGLVEGGNPLDLASAAKVEVRLSIPATALRFRRRWRGSQRLFNKGVVERREQHCFTGIPRPPGRHRPAVIQATANKARYDAVAVARSNAARRQRTGAPLLSDADDHVRKSCTINLSAVCGGKGALSRRGPPTICLPAHVIYCKILRAGRPSAAAMTCGWAGSCFSINPVGFRKMSGQFAMTRAFVSGRSRVLPRFAVQCLRRNGRLHRCALPSPP